MGGNEQVISKLDDMSIAQALQQIRRDLDDIAARFGNVPTYRKEINHALERIAAIEKHLGIDRKITA